MVNDRRTGWEITGIGCKLDDRVESGRGCGNNCSKAMRTHSWRGCTVSDGLISESGDGKTVIR